MTDTVAILGGTGAEGFGLALRWAQAGVSLIIGSREAVKARAAVERLKEAIPAAAIEGAVNGEAAARAAVVVLTVPLVAQIPTIKAVREKLRPGTVFVDATVPVGAALGDRIARLVTPWPGSAAQQAAAYLPPGVPLVSALHTLSAVALADLAHPLDCDVLICGDDAAAKAVVSRLVERIAGPRAIDAGPLENARFAEHLAALLIALNIGHKVRHSGVRFTGLPVRPET
jgi:NADPH-dependent F420 reductase